MAYVYRAEATIAAPPEAVWAALTDLAHQAWNPFTPEIRGELTPGRKITMKVVMGPGKSVVQRETVLEVTPSSRIVWGVVDPPRWLLHAERVQTLTPVDGGTHYQTVDTISGLITPLTHRLYGAGIGRGFTAMAAALKAHVEESVARTGTNA